VYSGKMIDSAKRLFLDPYKGGPGGGGVFWGVWICIVYYIGFSGEMRVLFFIILCLCRGGFKIHLVLYGWAMTLRSDQNGAIVIIRWLLCLAWG